MLATLLTIIISFFIFLTSAEDVFSYSGCYLSSSLQSMGLTSKGSYTWQSPSYCEGQCSGSAFIALSGGGNCYCGSDTNLLSVSKQSESNCNTGCYGWPAAMCGNSAGDYMNVYVNKDKVNTLSSSSSSASASTFDTTLTTSSEFTGSMLHSHSSLSLSGSVFVFTSMLSQGSNLPKSTTSVQASTNNQFSESSSVITTSTLAQASSSITSSISSTTNSVSSTQLTTKIVTKSVITTSNKVQRTIIVTASSVVETVVTTASASTYYNGTMPLKNKSASPLSGGTIAGIVVGCVAGVVIIIALVVFYFLYMKRHSKNDVLDIEESKQYQPYSFGDQDANPIIIPEPTGYLNHGSIKSKFNGNTNNSNNNSSWKLPSRSSTRNNSNSNLNGSNNSSDVFNMRNGSIHSSGTLTNRSIPMGNKIADGSNAHNSNVNSMSTFTNPSTLKTHAMRRSQLPSTVFEEPTNISFYDGVQRFSTSSLPDMMEEKKPLRIVNPDDSSVGIHDNSDNGEDNTNATTESGTSMSLSMDDEKY